MASKKAIGQLGITLPTLIMLQFWRKAVLGVDDKYRGVESVPLNELQETDFIASTKILFSL